MPSWFPAEQVFRAQSGWFVGSPAAFSLGPYPGRDEAEAVSTDIRARLTRATDKGEVIRIVRSFLDAAASASNPPEEVPTRAGERPRLWFRSERFFSVDNRWYFNTREGIDVGPYDSRQAAEHDNRRLIELLRDLETEEARMITIREFMQRPVLGRRLH